VVLKWDTLNHQCDGLLSIMLNHCMMGEKEINKKEGGGNVKNILKL
jgi:hypothetical protein